MNDRIDLLQRAASSLPVPPLDLDALAARRRAQRRRRAGMVGLGLAASVAVGGLALSAIAPSDGPDSPRQASGPASSTPTATSSARPGSASVTCTSQPDRAVYYGTVTREGKRLVLRPEDPDAVPQGLAEPMELTSISVTDAESRMRFTARGPDDSDPGVELLCDAPLELADVLSISPR